MGAVGVRRQIADMFKERVFASGLTYNSHPSRARPRSRAFPCTKTTG
jgi:hypothetical protein